MQLAEAEIFEPERSEYTARALKRVIALRGDVDVIVRLADSAGESEETVRLLLSHARDQAEAAPREAQAMLAAADRAVARLQSSPAPLIAALRGHVLLQRSTVLRLMGRYREALDILVVAEARFSEAVHCLSEIGDVKLARTGILFKMQRWSDAAQAATQTRHFYEKVGAVKRVQQARILAGCIAAERGDVSSVRRTFLDLLSQMTAGKADAATTARLWLDLAYRDARLNSPADARRWQMLALDAFKQSGKRTEATRSRWCGAKISALEGDVERAMQELQSVIDEFNTIDLPLDAGFAGLDLLEMILAGRDSRRAAALAQHLLVTFTRAGVHPAAAQALAYLREAVAHGSGHAELVRYVGKYIGRSFVYAGEPFHPPEMPGNEELTS